MRTYLDAKAMAKSLRSSLAATNIELSHSECLEIVSKQFGLESWNVLSAKLNRQKSEDQLACSFCRKSQQDVHILVEGGCHRPPQQPENCVFICDECIEFSSKAISGRADGTVRGVLKTDSRKKPV